MRPALIAAMLAASAIAGASPLRNLDLGTQSFRAKDYELTIRFVNPLLYPSEQLAQPEQLAAAHVLLGASYFEVGRHDDAKSEFEKALLLEPDKTLDTLLFSSGAVRLFDETKDDIAARRKRDDELRKLEEERERLRVARENLHYVAVQSLGLNFVPFGTGQLQERRFRAFGAFLSTELVTGGTSIAVYLYLQAKYPTGVPVQDVRLANALQVTGYVSAVSFWLLVAGGILDAYFHYRPRVEIALPPDVLGKPKKPNKTSLLDRIHVVPMPTPSGLGVGIGWED